jgi:indolepyruvate ferredoxin oxidoreductase beta subunit
MKGFNVVLAGVGGQGTVLAAEILGTAAMRDGLNVLVGEIHGMAQRGGAVVSTVRIGEEVAAATVLDGQANVLLGFEPLETLRNIKYASEQTLVIMSADRIPPQILASGNMKYPTMTEIQSKIHSFTKKVVLVEAARIAKEAGNAMAQNVVLLGALAGSEKLPFELDSLLEAVKELVPPKHVRTNVKAFNMGCKSVKESMRKG